MMLIQPINHIITYVSLNRNFLSSTRRLRDRTARGELLSKGLSRGLEIQTKSFQSRNLGNIFTFIALDTFDDDFASSALLGLTSLCGFCFGGFLDGVFFGTLLGVYGERAEVCGECGFGVKGAVEFGVVFFEPVGALLRSSWKRGGRLVGAVCRGRGEARKKVYRRIRSTLVVESIHRSRLHSWPVEAQTRRLLPLWRRRLWLVYEDTLCFVFTVCEVGWLSTEGAGQSVCQCFGGARLIARVGRVRVGVVTIWLHQGPLEPPACRSRSIDTVPICPQAQRIYAILLWIVTLLA